MAKITSPAQLIKTLSGNRYKGVIAPTEERCSRDEVHKGHYAFFRNADLMHIIDRETREGLLIRRKSGHASFSMDDVKGNFQIIAEDYNGNGKKEKDDSGDFNRMKEFLRGVGRFVDDPEEYATWCETKPGVEVGLTPQDVLRSTKSANFALGPIPGEMMICTAGTGHPSETSFVIYLKTDEIVIRDIERQKLLYISTKTGFTVVIDRTEDDTAIVIDQNGNGRKDRGDLGNFSVMLAILKRVEEYERANRKQCISKDMSKPPK